MNVSRQYSGYIEYVGVKPSAVRPGPPNASSSWCMTSLLPLAAHTWSAVSATPVSRAEVRREVRAQRDGVAVGVAVELAGRLGHRVATSATRDSDGANGFSLTLSRAAHVELRCAVRDLPPQVVAQREVVEVGHVSRRCDGLTRTSTAAAWPGRSSAFASATTCGATSSSARRVVVDDVDAAQEGLHRQARRVAGAAAGGQHVVGARGVVAERDRRVRADEDRAGVAHAHRDLAGVARLDLEVLGGVGVDDAEPGVEVVDENDAALRIRASASAMRSQCLVAGTCTASSASTASASSTLVVTSTEAAITSCSAWLIRSEATNAASAVSSARIAISVGPASESMPMRPLSRRLAAVT